MNQSVKQSSTIEQHAERAFEVHQQVVDGCAAIRKAWILLAAYLYEVNAQQYFKHLGHDTFNSWLGDLSLSRSHAYALIGIHAEYVIERNIDPAQIGPIEATKLAETLPALRAGGDPEELLSDAKVLSKSDLREKLRHESSGQLDAETARPICPTCGQRKPAVKP